MQIEFFSIYIFGQEGYFLETIWTLPLIFLSITCYYNENSIDCIIYFIYVYRSDSILFKSLPQPKWFRLCFSQSRNAFFSKFLVEILN